MSLQMFLVDLAAYCLQFEWNSQHRHVALELASIQCLKAWFLDTHMIIHIGDWSLKNFVEIIS